MQALAMVETDRHPAHVFLSQLRAGSGRHNQQAALGVMARMISPEADWASFPWHELRYPHTSLIRATLVERYAPATVNRHLGARASGAAGILEAGAHVGRRLPARRLDREPPLHRIPPGRALTATELQALFTAIASGWDQSSTSRRCMRCTGCFLRRRERRCSPLPR